MPDIFNLNQPDQSLIDARVQAPMPKPATAVPPQVDTSGGVGTQMLYARADHTHLSSVWAIDAATDASGNATFNFPAGFFTSPPCFTADIVNTNPAQLYNRAITTRTKDRIVVAVRAYMLLGVLSVPAAGLVVSLIARKASS